MCLILLAYKVDPEYPIVLASNRDEFYQRPTAPIHQWEDESTIIAGRDLEKQGTWLGISAKTGEFAAITNYRNPKEASNDQMRSRGEIPVNFLNSDLTTERFFQSLMKDRSEYPGFNFLAGNVNELYYYSNINNNLEKLSPGFYGLSNHFLNTEWPKVKIGVDGIKKWINQKNKSIDQLFALLQHAESASDEDLPDTGVGLELERMLSPLFIQSEHYGTRASTVLRYKSDDSVEVTERTYEKNNYTDRTIRI